MAELLRVPEVSAGAAEVLINEWLVAPGEAFTAGAPIALIETDKAVVELEAEHDAVLLKILVPAGGGAGVGTPIALLGNEGESASQPELGTTDHVEVARPVDALHDAPEEVPTPVPMDTHTEAEPAEPTLPARRPVGDATRVFISPLARKMLREAGLEPRDVTGSGPNGRIRRRDAEAAIRQSSQDRATSAPSDGGGRADGSGMAQPAWTEIPHSRFRRAIAARLARSKHEAPHFYLKRTAAIDELLALRQQLNSVAKTRISVNDMVIRAVSLAYGRVPQCNVIWTDEALRQYRSVDVSVAIASERGLVTPVIHAVETTSLFSIAQQVKTFVNQANQGRLQQRDLEGGTLTVTNLGTYGVEEFAAVINPPQSSILAVGAGVPTPVVVGGRVEVATKMALTLSVDHRAIDGALAATWMAALVDILEHPYELVI